jgi:hypothetical protein
MQVEPDAACVLRILERDDGDGRLMNESVMSRQAERESRYKFEPGQPVVVELLLQDEFEIRKAPATLVDLSRSGARLATDECIPVGQAARVLFSISDLGVVLYMATQVCWARENEEVGWLVRSKPTAYGRATLGAKPFRRALK